MFKCKRCGYQHEKADGFKKYPLGAKNVMLCTPCSGNVMVPHSARAGAKKVVAAIPDATLFPQNDMFDLLTPGEQAKEVLRGQE